MYVVLGTGEETRLRYADFSAYYRRLKAEFASTLADGFADIYPEPVAHCGLCRWSIFATHGGNDDYIQPCRPARPHRSC